MTSARPVPVFVSMMAVCLLAAPPAAGQATADGSGARAADPAPAMAHRAPAAPVVDGDVVGDEVWQQVAPLTGFVQQQPFDGNPASERTEVRLIFTGDTLYVGVVCFDREPGAIIVSDSRRDAPLTESDSFTMILDTYLDRQNGFVFGTNPAGIEYDGQVTNEGQGGGGLSASQMQASGSGGGFNVNWDGAWEVRVKITDLGWTAEFAIPFRTLRFPQRVDQVWGVNFQRNIRRRNERAFWSPVPRQYDLNRVSLARPVSGIQVPALRNLTITPYALGNAIQSGVNPADGKLAGDVGGDLKYSLTPSLVLDATVNTDFAQVEVDEQQVNLDRFNLFFPEKRPFFLENAGFFSVGNPGEVDLFFSRRIGLSGSGEAIQILGGGRVSGKAGRYNVGLLTMQTDAYRSSPSNNFAVARVSRDLPNRSSFGGLIVNRQGMGDRAKADDYNRTFALDGKLGIGQNTVLSSFVARTETPGVKTGRQYAYNVRTRTNLQRIDIEAGYQEVGERFNPEVGFLSRGGYRKPDLRLMTRFRPKDFLGLHELRPHLTYRSFWGFDGFQETGYTHIDNHWQFRNAYEVHTGMNLTVEGVRTPFEIVPGVVVPPGTYRHAEAQLVFMSNQGAPLSLDLRSNIGGFFGGDRVTLNPVVKARLGEALTTELSYSRNDVRLPGGTFQTNLVRARISYSFTTRAFVQTLVQYNDRADLWSMNLRFGWLQAANTGLFIVYNDTRYLYDLVERPERTDRSLVVKFSRMFDLLR